MVFLPEGPLLERPLPEELLPVEILLEKDLAILIPSYTSMKVLAVRFLTVFDDTAGKCSFLPPSWLNRPGSALNVVAESSRFQGRGLCRLYSDFAAGKSSLH